MRWDALTNQISYLLLILILLLILLIFLIRSEPAINNHHSDLCKDEVAYTRAWNHNTLAAEGRADESNIKYIEVIICNQVFWGRREWLSRACYQHSYYKVFGWNSQEGVVKPLNTTGILEWSMVGYSLTCPTISIISKAVICFKPYVIQICKWMSLPVPLTCHATPISSFSELSEFVNRKDVHGMAKVPGIRKSLLARVQQSHSCFCTALFTHQIRAGSCVGKLTNQQWSCVLSIKE